jgi:hypothetical protein
MIRPAGRTRDGPAAQRCNHGYNDAMSEAGPPPDNIGEPGPAPADPAPQVGFMRVLRYFVRLGTTGFGGPIATVGYMQRDLVEHRGWIDRRDFLDGVALGQTMPGPLAAQVAMWVGYLRKGAPGRWRWRWRSSPPRS